MKTSRKIQKNNYLDWNQERKKNRDQEIRRKQDKRRGIAEPRKLVKQRKINKRMKAERKGKESSNWKTYKENNTNSYSINPTRYEIFTAVSRTKQGQ